MSNIAICHYRRSILARLTIFKNCDNACFDVFHLIVKFFNASIDIITYEK